MPDYSQTQAAINAAMNSSTPDEIVSGVKSIVANQLADLSPEVKIEYTDYFNHTYMPDMVLSWGGRRIERRPIFLRNSLRLGPTLGDVRGLEDRGPVVLGLNPMDPEIGSEVRATARLTHRVFVTDMRSIDTAGRTSSAVNPATAPLLGIVRNNILQSGRGAMTVEDAQELVTATEQVIDSDLELANEAFDRFEALADDFFAEDGAYQVSRASRLLRAAQSPDQLAAFAMSSSGRLSETDLKILLPYLFARVGGLDHDLQFWSALSALIELEDLEVIKEIEDIDLGPLASEGIKRWTASRAELVPNSSYESQSDLNRTVWYVYAGKLYAEVGPWKLVFVSDDKRRLKGGNDSREANWADIAGIARRMVVESATLRGIARRLTIDAEESSNVLRDIEAVTSTLDDSYRVQHLILRIAGSQYSGVEVDFRKMLSTVQSGKTRVDELGTISLLLLGHRYPVDPAWLVEGLPSKG